MISTTTTKLRNIVTKHLPSEYKLVTKRENPALRWKTANLHLYSLVLVSRPVWNQIEYASITVPFPLSRGRKGKVKQIITATTETMLLLADLMIYAWLTNSSYDKEKISHAIHANLSQSKFRFNFESAIVVICATKAIRQTTVYKLTLFSFSVFWRELDQTS